MPGPGAPAHVAPVSFSFIAFWLLAASMTFVFFISIGGTVGDNVMNWGTYYVLRSQAASVIITIVGMALVYYFCEYLAIVSGGRKSSLYGLLFTLFVIDLLENFPYYRMIHVLYNDECPQMPYDYQPRAEVTAMREHLQNRPFLLMTGQSGAGKSTIASVQCQDSTFHLFHLFQDENDFSKIVKQWDDTGWDIAGPVPLVAALQTFHSIQMFWNFITVNTITSWKMKDVLYGDAVREASRMIFQMTGKKTFILIDNVSHSSVKDIKSMYSKTQEMVSGSSSLRVILFTTGNFHAALANQFVSQSKLLTDTMFLNHAPTTTLINYIKQAIGDDEATDCLAQVVIKDVAGPVFGQVVAFTRKWKSGGFDAAVTQVNQRAKWFLDHFEQSFDEKEHDFMATGCDDEGPQIEEVSDVINEENEINKMHRNDGMKHKHTEYLKGQSNLKPSDLDGCTEIDAPNSIMNRLRKNDFLDENGNIDKVYVKLAILGQKLNAADLKKKCKL